MPTYEITSPSGKKLRVTGEKPPTEQELEQIFSQFEVKPERTFAEKAAGVGEAALSAISSGVVEPFAGVAGLARTITQGSEAGAERVRQIQQAGTYQPRTAAGQEYLQDIAEAPIISDIAQTFERGSKYAGQAAMGITGSPAIAAIAEALPAAGAAYLGARAPKATAASREAAAQANIVEANKLTRSASDAINELKPKQSVTSQAFKTLSPDEIQDVADVDPDFFRAMEDVGLKAQPLTSYASRNPQFIGIEQGLTAVPGSPLSTVEKAFTKDLSESATNLMRQYGALDTGDASLKWRDNAMRAVGELEDEATAAYGALGEKIDKRQPANPVSSIEFIQAETDALPLGIADESAPRVLKSAFRQLQPRRRTNDAGEIEVVPANYASMDTLRRQIGAAAFKNEGPFKDADSALLKRLYASLTDDLNAMAESQGLVAEVKQAKAVVAKRKAIEERMQNLLGDNLQKDIEPVVAGAVKDLARGGLQKYVQTMKNIPEQSDRQQIVMTALNNIFTGTRAGQGGTFLTSDYLKWYNNTLGKPAVRSVIELDLPEGAAKKLDSLAKIAEGVTTAKSQKIPTGVVNSLLDDKAGFVRRLVGGAAQQTVGRMPGPTGELSTAIGSIIKADTKRSAAAGDILASPEFSYLIRRGVAEGVVTGKRASAALQDAEQKLMKSEKYKKWAQTLSRDEIGAISSIGLTAWLSGQERKPPK